VTAHLETNRLILRRFTADDIDTVYALHSDPEVMRYLGATHPTREQVRDDTLARFINLYRNSETWGYWASIERGTGSFIGWYLLVPPGDRKPAPGELEVGWLLDSRVWGRGFATEGAIALLDSAFRHCGARSVLAMTMAANERSTRVMERLGMRLVRRFDTLHGDATGPGFDQGEVEYSVSSEEWLAMH